MKRNELKMEVYLKFGEYHGLKGEVIDVSTKNGEPSYYVKIPVDNYFMIINKKQKNCVIISDKFNEN